MSSSFGGFDLGGVREVRIRSYTVGPGQSAQLISATMEIWRDESVEPELLEVEYAEDGPTLASVEAVIRVVNRRMRERRDPQP